MGHDCNRYVHQHGGKVPAKQLRHAAALRTKGSEGAELQHTVALPTSCHSHKVLWEPGTGISFTVTQVLIGFTMSRGAY